MGNFFPDDLMRDQIGEMTPMSLSRCDDEPLMETYPCSSMDLSCENESDGDWVDDDDDSLITNASLAIFGP